MLIVDEAQTLESERGHLLELLLLKLRALNPQIQVVFLSATLPNPRAIARWLDAALYLYAERMQRDPPSQRVTEYAVVNGEVRSRDGAILRRLGVSDRTGALRELVRDEMGAKLQHLPDDVRDKLGHALGRIINEGSGGMICILL